MARHRIKKYSRRRNSSPYKKSKAPVVISVIVFILLSLTVSVGIGLVLGNKAGGVAADSELDLGRADYDSNGKRVRAVEAYHFPLGANPYDYVYQTIYDMSVLVSHKDGTLDYAFDVADKYNRGGNGEYSFKSLTSSAHDAGGRICAYIYVRSFDCEDEYERELQAAYEIALIHEMAESGADDILLLGIDITDDNIADVERYVARAATAAQKAPLGVAVSLELIELAKNESYLMARVRSSCDYLALDLTHLKVEDGESSGEELSLLEEILTENRYYIKSYPMRILFSRAESKLYIPALDLGVRDLQIISE